MYMERLRHHWEQLSLLGFHMRSWSSGGLECVSIPTCPSLPVPVVLLWGNQRKSFTVWTPKPVHATYLVSIWHAYGSCIYLYISLNISKIFIICVCGSVCTQLDSEARSVWGWSYRWRWVTFAMWVLGTEPRPFATLIFVLNHWTISPVHFFLKKLLILWKLYMYIIYFDHIQSHYFPPESARIP